MGRILSLKWYISEFDDPKKMIKLWKYNECLNGIEHWLPEFSCYKLIDGLWRDVSEPLFPGYLFLYSVRGPSYIEYQLDVELIKFGGKYHYLSNEDVSNIKSKESVCQHVLDDVFECGDKIMVKEDARSSYAGFTGVFLCPVKVDFGYYARVKIGFDNFKPINVSIPYDHIEPCIKENTKG